MSNWESFALQESAVASKYAILLFQLFKEISLWPEISSPPGFRIQGGSRSMTNTHTHTHWRTEILVSNTVFLVTFFLGKNCPRTNKKKYMKSSLKLQLKTSTAVWLSTLGLRKGGLKTTQNWETVIRGLYHWSKIFFVEHN